MVEHQITVELFHCYEDLKANIEIDIFLTFTEFQKRVDSLKQASLKDSKIPKVKH